MQSLFINLPSVLSHIKFGLAILIFSMGAVSSTIMMAAEPFQTLKKTINRKSVDPVPKGNRILAIKVNQGEDGDFPKAFNEALLAGNETQVVPQDWNELETAPGRYAPEPNFLAIANYFYSAHRMPIHLSIRPVHTNQKAVPADLLEIPFDDPRTIARFKQLLDWISTQIPKVTLTSLTIGSEVNIFAWGDPKKWEAWTRFYAAVAPYARKKFPGTLISCETSYAAFVGPDLERVRQLHQYSDAIGLSYYPMKHKLRGVKSAKSVHADFSTIVNAIPDKPIIYYQIGYPSSSILGSSPKQQAMFMTEAFRAWDAHADRILMLNFQWMHETPKFGLDQFAAYYKYDTPNFRAFLGSLGLQSWSGQPKPAWNTLAQEAKARGF